MNFLNIESLIVVLKYGSFSAAAEQMFIAQPTLTHRIKQLETELGEKLIHRDSKGVYLTDAGRLFMPYARQIMDGVLRSKQVMENTRKGLSGILHFGASLAVTQYILPNILGSFMQEHPSVRINVISHSSDVILRKISEREFTFGITLYTINHPQLAYECLDQDPVSLIVSPLHRFSSKRQVLIQEACEEKLFLFQEGTPYRNFIEQSLIQSHIHIQSPMELNNMELTKSLIKQGCGVAFLPNLYVQQELDSGELLSIELDHNPFQRNNTYLAFNPNYTDPSFDIFSKYLRDYFSSIRCV